MSARSLSSTLLDQLAKAAEQGSMFDPDLIPTQKIVRRKSGKTHVQTFHTRPERPKPTQAGIFDQPAPDPAPDPAPASLEDRVRMAKEMGTAAFEAGLGPAPASNPAFTPLIRGLKVGEGAHDVLGAYTRAWHAANLAAPVPDLDEPEPEPEPERERNLTGRFGDTLKKHGLPADTNVERGTRGLTRGKYRVGGSNWHTTIEEAAAEAARFEKTLTEGREREAARNAIVDQAVAKLRAGENPTADEWAAAFDIQGHPKLRRQIEDGWIDQPAAREFLAEHFPDKGFTKTGRIKNALQHAASEKENQWGKRYPIVTLRDLARLLKSEEPEPSSTPEPDTPPDKSDYQSRDKAGTAATNLLERLGNAGGVTDLYNRLLDSDEFHLRVKPPVPGLEPLVIEKRGRDLMLSHYRTDGAIDSEVILRFDDNGVLSLHETAHRDPYEDREIRGFDPMFARVFLHHLDSDGYAATGAEHWDGRDAPDDEDARMQARDDELLAAVEGIADQPEDAPISDLEREALTTPGIANATAATALLRPLHDGEPLGDRARRLLALRFGGETAIPATSLDTVLLMSDLPKAAIARVKAAVKGSAVVKWDDISDAVSQVKGRAQQRRENERTFAALRRLHDEKRDDPAFEALRTDMHAVSGAETDLRIAQQAAANRTASQNANRAGARIPDLQRKVREAKEQIAKRHAHLLSQPAATEPRSVPAARGDESKPEGTTKTVDGVTYTLRRSKGGSGPLRWFADDEDQAEPALAGAGYQDDALAAYGHQGGRMRRAVDPSTQHVYASPLRPLGSWASRLRPLFERDAAEIVDTPASASLGKRAHSYVFSNEPLDDETIDAYQLVPVSAPASAEKPASAVAGLRDKVHAALESLLGDEAAYAERARRVTDRVGGDTGTREAYFAQVAVKRALNGVTKADLVRAYDALPEGERPSLAEYMRGDDRYATSRGMDEPSAKAAAIHSLLFSAALGHPDLSERLDAGEREHATTIHAEIERMKADERERGIRAPALPDEYRDGRTPIPARPAKLADGETWGAQVPYDEDDLRPGMPLRVTTRGGKEWDTAIQDISFGGGFGTVVVTAPRAKKPKPAPAPKAAPKPEPAPEPPAPAEAAPASPYDDVGDVIPLSRKELAALRKRLTLGDGMTAADLDRLEATGEGIAEKFVTKQAIIAKRLEDPRALGMSPGAAYFAKQVLKVVEKQPKGADQAGRARFYEALDRMVGAFTQARTVEDVLGVLGEMHAAYQTAEEPLRAMEQHYLLLVRYKNGDVDLPTVIARVGQAKWDAYLEAADNASPIVFLGKRFIKLTGMNRRFDRYEVPWGVLYNHLRTARQHEKADDWTWLEPTAAAGKPKPKGPEKPTWERTGPDEAIREGGELRQFDSQALIDTFGIKGVQYGNYMTEAFSAEHTQRAGEALLDLADVLGLDPKQVSLNGRLSIAFGARGSGSGLAHYETATTAINMTKHNGGGSLAHEWGHFLDNMLARVGADFKHGHNEFATDLMHNKGRRSYGDIGGVPTTVTNALREVYRGLFEMKESVEASVTVAKQPIGPKTDAQRHTQATRFIDAAKGDAEEAATLAIENTRERIARYGVAPSKAIERLQDIFQHIANATGKPVRRTFDYTYTGNPMLLAAQSMPGDYFRRPVEMFARAFESYVIDKMEATGRSNSYLVSGVSKDAAAAWAREQADRLPGRGVSLYPLGEQRERLTTAFDTLIAAMHDTGTFKKATMLLSAMLTDMLAKAAEQGSMFGSQNPDLIPKKKVVRRKSGGTHVQTFYERKPDAPKAEQGGIFDAPPDPKPAAKPEPKPEPKPAPRPEPEAPKPAPAEKPAQKDIPHVEIVTRDMLPMERARLFTTLNKPVRRDGTVAPAHEHLNRMRAAGYEVATMQSEKGSVFRDPKTGSYVRADALGGGYAVRYFETLPKPGETQPVTAILNKPSQGRLEGLEFRGPDGTITRVLNEPTTDPSAKDFEPETRVRWTYPPGSRRAGQTQEARMTLQELVDDLDRMQNSTRRLAESVDPLVTIEQRREASAQSGEYRHLKADIAAKRDAARREAYPERRNHLMRETIAELSRSAASLGRSNPVWWGTPDEFYVQVGDDALARLTHGIKRDTSVVRMALAKTVDSRTPSVIRMEYDHFTHPDVQASLAEHANSDDGEISPAAITRYEEVQQQAAERAEADAAAARAGEVDTGTPATIRERATALAASITDRSLGDAQSQFIHALKEFVPDAKAWGDETLADVALRDWHGVWQTDDAPRDQTNTRLKRMTAQDLERAITAFTALQGKANAKNGTINATREDLIAGLKSVDPSVARQDYQATFGGTQIVGLNDHMMFVSTDGFTLSTQRIATSSPSSIGQWWIPHKAGKALATAARKLPKGTNVSLHGQLISIDGKPTARFMLHADGETVFEYTATDQRRGGGGSDTAGPISYAAWTRLGLNTADVIGSGAPPAKPDALGIAKEEAAKHRLKRNDPAAFEYRVSKDGTVTRSADPIDLNAEQDVAYNDHPRYLGVFNARYVEPMVRAAGKNATITRLIDPNNSKGNGDFLRITNPDGYRAHVIGMRRNYAKALGLTDTLTSVLMGIGITLPDPPPLTLYDPAGSGF